MNKNTADIANGQPVRAKTQRTPIRVERLISVKENVRLDNIATGRTQGRHCQRACSKPLAEYGVGDDDRVDSVPRRNGRTGDGDSTSQPGHDLASGREGWR